MNSLEEIPEEPNLEEDTNFLEELDPSVYHLEELENSCALKHSQLCPNQDKTEEIAATLAE